LTAKFSISIPPLKEQNRIVEKLDELLSELEKGKEQLQTSLEQLKVYRQAILKHAFEGKLSEEWRIKQKKLKTPDELVAEIKAYRKQQYEKQLKEYKSGKIKVKPKEPTDFTPVSKKISETFKAIPTTWFWTQIHEISDNIAYGYTEKSSKEKIGPKFLRITDIQDNAVNWNTVPYCKIDKDKIGQYLLSKGDLVFARTGATVGKSFLIRNEPPDAVYASYLIRIRIYKIFIPEFMAYFFQSDFYWKQITEGQVGIGQPNVNGSKLSELFIPLMSQDEQRVIVELLDTSMSNCDQLERTIIENIGSS
jgi:type I restriction enzyme S subunit